MTGPISSPVFVGRELELASLEALLDKAGAGEGTAVLVAGESGIGKSRLVAEFRRRARARGFTVLTGECLELAEGELPYAPLVGALRSLLRGQDRAETEELLGGAREPLSRLLPEPGAADPPRSTAPQGDQARLFEALLEVLTKLAAEDPILLVIEDLHWADRSTRDFLAFLVRNARRERLAVVTTYRSDEVHRRHPLRPFFLELERSGGVERMDLSPFSFAELEQQLRAISGRTPDRECVERLLERSDGNPFFVEELRAAASEDGVLPDSLRDALLLRIERLSPSAQSVLRIAAVAGRSVDHGLLEALTDLAQAELNRCLREAIAGYVLTRDDDGTGYRFRHALLREAAYEDLLPGERRDLHVALARTLTGRPELAGGSASAAAELAFHWHAADELGPALEASVRAGVEAESAKALAEASIQYRRALEIWETVGATAASRRWDALR